jgi:hypothetical protein
MFAFESLLASYQPTHRQERLTNRFQIHIRLFAFFRQQTSKSSINLFATIMADALNLNGLSIDDSKHANGFGPGRKPAYIPPHMRGKAGDGPAPAGPAPVANAPPAQNGNWAPR